MCAQPYLGLAQSGRTGLLLTTGSNSTVL